MDNEFLPTPPSSGKAASHMKGAHSHTPHANAEISHDSQRMDTAVSHMEHKGTSASSAARMRAFHERRAQNGASSRLSHAHMPRATRNAATSDHQTSPALKLALIVCACVALLFIGVCAWIMIQSTIESTSSQTQIQEGTEIKVAIPEGSSASTIAATLKKAGVIADSAAFLKEVQRLDAMSKMKSGSYLLVATTDYEQIIQRLVQGPNAQENALVVPEGLTQTQTSDLLQKTYGLSEADVKAAMKASSYQGDYPFLKDAANDSLEGFLFPKTYDFAGKTPSASDAIQAMLSQYKKEISVLDFDSARKSIKDTYGVEMSDYDFLRLASIIEKEALTDDQRALVASVFYNRLKQNKPLESDATMGYVTGGKVTPDDLKKESPYNSYLNRGLPPTPICSPGIASISAALAPKESNYLYFWITEKEAVFSETFEQHQQAIAQAK